MRFLSWGQWQGEEKYGAAFGAVGDLQGAAMRFDDGVADVQSESVRLGAEEGLKKFLLHGFRDAGTVVADLDQDRAFDPERDDVDHPLCGRQVLHGLHGILHQIEQYLPQQDWISAQLRQVFGQLHPGVRLLPLQFRAQHRQCVVEDGMYVAGFVSAATGVDEAADAPDDVAGALSLGHDVVERRRKQRLLFPAGNRLGGQRKIGQRHQRLVELVCHRGGDLAQAGEVCAAGISKNVATGCTAAHVYETPGTYMASLTITDMAGTVRTYKQTIIVTEFAGLPRKNIR